MKKLYLLFLALLLLFMPVSHAVAVYQLDQPVSELNGYTLREVFENRNHAMPDLTGKEFLVYGVYRVYNANGVTIDYNVYNGSFIVNGQASSTVLSGFYEQSFIKDFSNILGYSTLSFIYESGTGAIGFRLRDVNQQNGLFIPPNTSTNATDIYNFEIESENFLRVITSIDRVFDNFTFKLQLEKGIIATPYQVPTNGPYNDIDVGEFNLTTEQIETYYDLYLEAVRFQIENVEAGKDSGGYQSIFRSIINGVRGLINEMGYLWQWLNAPLITSDMSNYSFSIDWSWDLIGVIRQLMNALGVLTLQVLFVVPNLVFKFMGIPIRISILSLLFSNIVFLIIGWIFVKSFVI